MAQYIIRDDGKFRGNCPLTVNGTLRRFPIDEAFDATSDELAALEDAGVVVETVYAGNLNDGDAITVTNSAGGAGSPGTVAVDDLGAVTAALGETKAIVTDQQVIDGKTLTVVDGVVTTIV